MKFTDRIITLTPGIEHDICTRFRTCSQKKFEVIPLGLDLGKNLRIERKSTDWRRKLGLDSDVFLAGIVARLVPVKNHAMLIEAIAKISAKVKNLHLAIVGGGELETALRAQASRLGIADRIHFCGIVNEIEDVYSDLDLLVLSSKNEGTPVVIIEALASGCPVAATDVGGIRELLENGRLGYLLDSDIERFTSGLASAVFNARNFREDYNERRKIAGKFSVNTLIERMHSLYSRTLEYRGINGQIR